MDSSYQRHQDKLGHLVAKRPSSVPPLAFCSLWGVYSSAFTPKGHTLSDSLLSYFGSLPSFFRLKVSSRAGTIANSSWLSRIEL